MNDEGLLKLIKRSPDAGMEQLIKTYGALVCSIIRGRLAGSVFGESDIEDVAADTLADFWSKLDDVDLSKGSVKAYLCVIARRNAADALRKHYRIRQIPIEKVPEAELAYNVGGAENAERLALTEAVEALGKPDSELIVRKYYLGQSSKEIADALGLSVSNVDTRTHRALMKLRKTLEEGE